LERSIGVPVFDALGLRDVIIEINVLANRPDMRTHAGVAREIEVGFRMAGLPCEPKKPNFPDLVSEADVANAVAENASMNVGGDIVTAENELGISAFFVGLENVKPVPSPAWLRNLLEGMGQNSINNVVDASNFVLLAHGQPSHAFDISKLSSYEPHHKKIVLRMARENELFLGLDAKERVLATADCVVADSHEPQAVLGVIGGDKSKVDASTTRIVVEMANAHPVAVRRTSRRIGRHTDSSMTFEKGIDTASRFEAVCHLISVIAATSPEKPRFVGAIHSTLQKRSVHAESVIPREYLAQNLGPSLEKKVAVDFSLLARGVEVKALRGSEWIQFATDKVAKNTMDFPRNALLNLVGDNIVSWEKSLEILRSLGFLVTQNGESGACIAIPHWRWHDVSEVPDLVEEVVRVVGIDSVPAVPLVSRAALTRDDDHIAIIENVVQKATQFGYIETAGYHFMREDDLPRLGLPSMSALGEPVVLMNPIIRDEPMMHTTLVPDLLRKVARNISYGTARGMLCHVCRTYQNLSLQGDRVFPENGKALGIDTNWSQSPLELFEYAPAHALAYSREKNQSARPAETPRLAGVAFGERVTKTWQTSGAVPWDLHSVMAHVNEVLRSEGVEAGFEAMPPEHPFAKALHPGRRVCVTAILDGAPAYLGWVAEFHPQALRNFSINQPTVAFELNLASVYRARLAARVSAVKRVAAPRRFPTVSRDFAFVMAEGVSASALMACVQQGLFSVLGEKGVPARLGRIDIFDIYRGKGVAEGSKSVAFSVSVEPTERTLADADIQKLASAVVEFVKNQLGGELRG
jgi:phenylalanyl-tRNA synthetase beta chain